LFDRDRNLAVMTPLPGCPRRDGSDSLTKSPTITANACLGCSYAFGLCLVSGTGVVAQSWFGAAEPRYAHQARARYPPAEQYYQEGASSDQPTNGGEPIAVLAARSCRWRCLDPERPWSAARTRRTHPGLRQNQPGLCSPTGRATQALTTRRSRLIQNRSDPDTSVPRTAQALDD
jgi:hypothetical protein